MAQPLRREVQFEPQLRQVVAAKVAQLAVLQIVPNALRRIEFRGVSRQGFELEPSRGSLREKILDGLGAVNRGAIPQYEQLAGNPAEQVAEEGNDGGAPEGLCADLEQQAAGVGQAADDRQM